MPQTVILGAGMAGLAAAAELRSVGHDVVIVDKGRSVGGRLATRRIGEAVFDHGAQFFTTRGAGFVDHVARAIDAGVVVEWCRGFALDDGYPRYRAERGMTALAKWMAQGCKVVLDTEVDRIAATGRSVSFVDRNGDTIVSGDHAIVTAPIPQTVALLDRSDIRLPEALDTTLRAVEYFATLALLVVVEGPTAIPEPGGVQLDDGPFTFVADNLRKGISPSPGLTFHAEHDYSRRRFDDDPERIAAELLELARPWIGSATVRETQLKKWRYAGPKQPLPAATEVFEAGEVRIALAGDAFAGPKVEGAFNSGVAAAAAISPNRRSAPGV